MSRLVGRDRELARLMGILDGVVGGTGRLALLSGAAGIGTSRVLRELLDVAGARGFVTLHGCPSGPTLAPVLDALRDHLAALPALTRAALMTDVPVLDAVLTGGLPVQADDLEHTRLADAVARLVGRLAERAPVLFAVDDVHRADGHTVALLQHVASRLAARPVMVLLAYRVLPGGVLDAIAAHARRHDPAAEVVLGPLTDDAVRELVGEAATDELVRRAAGFPLFALALATDNGLPAAVRDAVRDAAGSLDDRDRAVLELVAVAGSATAGVLDAAAPGSRAALRRLVAAGFVVEDPEPAVPCFRPAHPLYGEVIAADLLADDRRTLHAALAALLDGDPAAAAPHYLGGRGFVEPERAGEVLRVAGFRAAAERADVEAERYLRAAAEHAETPEVLAALGRVRERLGRPADALDAWSRAIPLADAAGNGVLADALRVDVASLEFERGASSAAIGVDRAAEHAVTQLLWTSRFGDAARIRLAADRLTSFAGAGDDPGMAAAELGRTHLAMLRGDFAAARVHAEASVVHGRRQPGELFAGIAERELARLALLAGDLATAREHAQRNLDGGVALGAPRVECSGRINVALLDHLAGDMDGALRETGLGLAAGRLAGTPRSLSRALLASAVLAADQGRSRAARGLLSEAERVAPGGNGESSLIALAEMTRVLLALGGARPQHVPAMTDWSFDADPQIMCVRPLLAGRALLAAGDRAGVEVQLQRLRGVGRSSPLLAAFADRLEGLALRSETGTDLLAAAAGELDRMGVRLHAAQAHLEWAERAAERGQPRIREVVIAALEVFDTAGLTGWSDRGRRLARHLGLRVPTRRTSAGPLTAREAEVAGLVADGRSNAEIAGALFLSERTVETHMRSIYARLGLASRVDLAAWVGAQTDLQTDLRAATDGPAGP